MKIVSTSYINTPEFNDPEKWLDRIGFHTGILEELAKKYQVESIEQINYRGMLKRKGVQYHFLNFKKPKLYFPLSLHRYIKNLKPDLILVNGFIFPLQIIQLRIKLGSRINIVVINHAEKPYTGLKKILQRLADKCVQRYFFTAKETGAEWVHLGIIANEKKIIEVMEASSLFQVMDKEKALTKTGIAGSPVFLFVGRLDANKDPLTVVKAFGAFINHQPSAKLYMIYHTEELLLEIIHFLEKGPSLKNAVKLVGKVPHDEMQYWYNSSDFIISASYYEGSGVAVCEAMSCGCIPVLTNIPSFRKMTGSGPQDSVRKCGLIYEPGNDKALLKVLLQTSQLDMEKERIKVLQQFKAELSFEAIAKKMEEAFTPLNLK